jgi:hypothetical protein
MARPSRLTCASCGTTLLILSPAHAHTQPTCCRSAMVPAGPIPCSAPLGDAAADAAGDGRLRAGQVYVDEPSGLTVRCIRPGQGDVTVDGRSLRPQAAGNVALRKPAQVVPPISRLS